MDRYLNRQEAGQILAKKLAAYAKKPHSIVLALPRGGVPVAFEVARALHIPMDVFVARKLGVPAHEELAMGAIAQGGVSVLNENIIRELRIAPEAIKRRMEEEAKELERRVKAYRGKWPEPPIKDQTVIVVDDGIATGATMRAVIKALKQQQPAKLIIAVPVAEKSTYESFSKLVDEFICPLCPLYFNAVGSWYEKFDQTTDEEVLNLLIRARLSLDPSQGATL